MHDTFCGHDKHACVFLILQCTSTYIWKILFKRDSFTYYDKITVTSQGSLFYSLRILLHWKKHEIHQHYGQDFHYQIVKVQNEVSKKVFNWTRVFLSKKLKLVWRWSQIHKTWLNYLGTSKWFWRGIIPYLLFH